MARFVLTDERLNCYGTRIITKGVDLKDFLKNPVMLYMHTRGLVIGKWEDVQVSKEDATISAEGVFDQTDPFAQSIESKVNQKILNACSSGLEILEWSEKPEMLVAGQTRPTITKSILNEASIVDIPGNKNALRLHLGAGLWLTEDATANAESLNKFLPTLNLQTQKPMDEILLALGLAAGSTPAQVVAAIQQMRLNAANAHADTIISIAEKAGLVDAGNKDKFTKLAAADPGLALHFLGFDQLKKPTATDAPEGDKPGKDLRLADVVREVNSNNTTNLGGTGGTAPDPRAAWTMREWEKKDSKGLLALKASNSDRYNTMYEAQYGRKPNS
ncbi:hypothetical protein GCM10023185_15460 [Hymenobacter saemangeumensis]|uniref:Prohead serine protease domain-containing protein n=1 Tax=Hymenobacter saemangeumensis TaxID=1084522 RepID=A0ABP8I991_9BACT